MKNRLILPLLIFAAIFIYSCGDVIEEPFTKVKAVDTTTTLTQKKVLLEDYTGFTCGNCPTAGDLAKQILKNYPGKVILMGVHAGPYAKTSTKHPYDFRTAAGTEYDNFFGISKASNPNGMINRKGFTSGQKTHIFLPSKWENEIIKSLAEAPKVKLGLTSTYNAGTKTAKIDVTINYLEDLPNNLSLMLFMIEDSIIQYQTDYRLTNPDVDNYVHMHVLRDNPLGTWGEVISATDVKAGAKITKTFNYTIPAGKDWKPKDMKIIAAVQDNGKSYEILQVEETELIH